MKVNYVKIAVLTTVGLATIFGGVMLVRYFRTKNEQRNLDEEIDLSNGTVKETKPSSSSKPSSSKPKPFDSNRIVKKGSKDTEGQNEVKTVQLALNGIIDDAKKVDLTKLGSGYKPTTTNGVSSWALQPYQAQAELEKLASDVKRIKSIASLTKLYPDGDFGGKSEIVLMKIMSEPTTTYSKVKQKRINFANAYGLPNPYKK